MIAGNSHVGSWKAVKVYGYGGALVQGQQRESWWGGEGREQGSGSICFLHLAPDTLDARQWRSIFTCFRFAMGWFSGAQGQSGSVRGRAAIPALSGAGQGNYSRRLVKSLLTWFVFCICIRTAGSTVLSRCLPAASCSEPPCLWNPMVPSLLSEHGFCRGPWLSHRAWLTRRAVKCGRCQWRSAAAMLPLCLSHLRQGAAG